jgi:hypothetical protein
MTPKTLTFAYSDRDIERLWNLKRQDYASVRAKWRKGHFDTAFSLWQLAVWAVAAVAVWYLAFNPNALRVAANPLPNDLPVWGFRVVAITDGLASVWYWILLHAESEFNMGQGESGIIVANATCQLHE